MQTQTTTTTTTKTKNTRGQTVKTKVKEVKVPGFGAASETVGTTTQFEGRTARAIGAAAVTASISSRIKVNIRRLRQNSGLFSWGISHPVTGKVAQAIQSGILYTPKMNAYAPATVQGDEFSPEGCFLTTDGELDTNSLGSKVTASSTVDGHKGVEVSMNYFRNGMMSVKTRKDLISALAIGLASDGRSYAYDPVFEV